MIRNIFLALTLLAITACQDDPRKADISEVEKSAEFRRFDRALFESDTSDFQEELNRLEREFPEFFSAGSNPAFWRAQRTDPQQLKLYREAQKVFDDTQALNENLNFSMKHYYYYYPDEPEIEFYAYISNLDFDYPVLYADSVCFAALDLYLGPKKPFYHPLPEYVAFYRQPGFLVRDCIEAVIDPKIAKQNQPATLLDDMFYHGKKLYFLERMMPQKSEEIIVQYTPEELAFCNNNERTIWSYFIEHNHLFSSSQDLKRRFIELAPFSKFRMKNDPETPGMIGRWVGWQMVREFMENNPEVSLQQLAQETDSRKVLKLSGYKP